jgi:diguanylate cyclase (GGDEF)-like protein/putative nucleotidyltransferase with HDIG domain
VSSRDDVRTASADGPKDRGGSVAPAADSWRLLGLLFVASGAIGLMALALGMDSSVAGGVMWGLAGVAVLSGLIALRLAAHLPEAALIVGLVLCTGFVCIAVAFSGGHTSPFVLFYPWVAVEASYFVNRRRAVAFIAATAVASGATLVAVDGVHGGVLPTWSMIVGSMIAVGALTAALRARSDRLIESLADRAARDSLTGLANRRGYHFRIERELERAQRHGLPLSIVLADIDHFKSLNDAFGHRRGDQALREFGELCRQELRATDLVSRVGGEEFAIVLPHVDEHEAVATAERLRLAVRERLHTPDGHSLSASFGVASFPQHGSDPEVLLDHADQAMYTAKHLGRDRTVVFDAGLLQALRGHAPAEHIQAVLVLAEALDLRDVGTAAHSQTVGRLCAAIARAMGLSGERVERLRVAGILHDVGKLGVPDDILRKPGKLTDAEFAEMRKHPELGARMVAGAGLTDVAGWVRAHHERLDGRGYPFGLRAEDIPLEARILAVGDAYEAMTADRPYRDAPGHDYAVEELRRGCGTQFDPDVAEALLATLAPGPAVALAEQAVAQG